MSGVSYNFGATDKEIAERRAREKAVEERAAEERKEGEMLVDIGKHCAKCHQKTFLPFVCSKCGLSFCTEHRLDHNCQGAAGAQTTASQDTRPVCPLCGRAVDVKPGESVDAAVSHHIDAGCPKPPTCVTFRCCCPGCRTEELVPCVCSICGKNTCLKHRFPADHPCKPQPEPAHDSRPSSVGKSKGGDKNRAALTRSAEQNARAALFADTKKRCQKKNGGTLRRLELMKCKAGAQGNQSIPPERREFFEIVFPLSATTASAKKPPTYMFFDVKWSIGKILDEIAAKGHVINRNHIAGAPRLVLIALLTGTALPTSKTLADALREGLVHPGDPILLDTDDILSE